MEAHEITESQHSKTARLEARVTEEQKELFSKAAALQGRSLSDFVVNSVYENATRTLREHQLMTLSAHDCEVFVSALLNPPEPGKRLRRAAQRYRERIGK